MTTLDTGFEAFDDRGFAGAGFPGAADRGFETRGGGGFGGLSGTGRPPTIRANV